MFKHDKDKIRLLSLHPILLMIMFDMKYYCEKEKLRYQVTSTLSSVEEDKKLSRKSSTHRTGRAFDLSLREWSDLEIKDFMNYFSNKYNAFAATNKEGVPSLIVRHDSGHGDHLHVQINYRYKLKEFTNKMLSEL